jgi:4-hydroxyphenylacetate decarboxylase small subunit
MNDALKHMDCRNFAAVDAAKGICHRTKELLAGDGEHCEHCVPIPKCKFCVHFTLTEQYLGACNAVAARPMAYPDLIAVTCDLFAATHHAERS